MVQYVLTVYYLAYLKYVSEKKSGCKHKQIMLA